MASTRATISISDPNENWIQAQIDNGEFASRSEVVNDAIRKERERTRQRDFIVAKLIAAEQSPIVDASPEEILAGFKEEARKDGLLPPA